MRKTSQDGGDSSSISSSVENEFKRPGAGILKSTRNSIKRKVQSLNTEVDEAVVEPLLQKDKESNGKNLCAKSLLSKSYQTKTDHDKSEECKIKYTSENVVGENETKYVNKQPVTTTFKAGLTTENDSASRSNISVTDDKNIISNNLNKQFKAIVTISTVQITPNGIEGNRIRTCDNISTAVGYIPSTLIFTTAKIHADTKYKDLAPININAVPILSTTETKKSTTDNKTPKIDIGKQLTISSIEKVTKNTPTSSVSLTPSTYDKGGAMITDLIYKKSASPDKQMPQSNTFINKASSDTKGEIGKDPKNVCISTSSPSDINANCPKNVSIETSLGSENQNQSKIKPKTVISSKTEICELSKTEKDIACNAARASNNISSTNSSSTFYKSQNPVECIKIEGSKSDKSALANKSATNIAKEDDKSGIMIKEKINQSPVTVSDTQISKPSTLRNGNITNMQAGYELSSMCGDTHVSSQKVNSVLNENKIVPKSESSAKSSTKKSSYAVASSTSSELKEQHKIPKKSIDSVKKAQHIPSSINSTLQTSESKQNTESKQQNKLSGEDSATKTKASLDSSSNLGKIQQAKQLQRQKNTTESDDTIGTKVTVSKGLTNPSVASSISSSTKIGVCSDAKIASKNNAIQKNIQATKGTEDPMDSKSKLTKTEGKFVSSSESSSKTQESKSKTSKS
ncbi:hypothetical protein EVAR_42411_1 [Eumeta japonica]|uniref:Uncharacterized protein n=1 Tax=Eumeta variegata TaxID=151549 RepID=A0A4C1X6T3_EUMVA|nr:hypothetical protein EVAR_42411_1 [Eumeta japonica]